MEKLLGVLMLLVLPTSISLHLWFKPRFWLPSFIVYCLAGATFGIWAAFVANWPDWEVLKATTLFGFLFFSCAVFVGRIFQAWIFPAEYAEKSIADTRSAGFVRRSRIVGVFSVVIGSVLISVLWPLEDRYEWLLAATAFVFIGLGLSYIFSWRGGATHREWVQSGAIIRNARTGADSQINAAERQKTHAD